jgi:hypothetical protein
MRIWEHTVDELTGGKEPLPDQDVELPEFPFDEKTVVPITQNLRYATALAGVGFADQVLLQRFEGGWKCVGSYVGDTIYLDPSVRGMQLAEELVLRCAEHRHPPATTNLTRSGYSLLKRVHQLAVARAYEAGLPIPAHVLAEYPDLD